MIRGRVVLVVCLFVVGGMTGVNNGALSLTMPSAPSTPSTPTASLVQVQSGNDPTNTTTTVVSTATVRATTTVTMNCSELPTLEQVQIERDELPALNQNLTSDDALEFAVVYEMAYAEEHVVPDDAGMSEPTATVNQTGNGYLVKVTYIYGGTNVITAQPTGNQTTPATTVIEWDQFPEIYYYVSPTRVLRSSGPEPPEHPRTKGKVIYCDA